MHRYWIAAAMTALATPARADEIAIKPIVDARLRYEHVDQQGVAVKADAVTMRMRAGAEAKTGAFAFLVEGEGTLALVEDYTKSKVIRLDNVVLTATYHDYRSDRPDQHYGNEWAAQIVARKKHTTFTLKYADYNAKAFATDTRKFWASVEWAY